MAEREASSSKQKSSKGTTSESKPTNKSKKDLPTYMEEMSAPETMTLDPGLVAIAIVIRSKDGPRFVFHYPARPSTKFVKRPKLFGTEVDLSDSEDEEGKEDESDLEDSVYTTLHDLSKIDLSANKKYHVDPDIKNDEHHDTPTGEQIVPWEHVFEYSTTDLESILTPSRQYHKKRFELGLDPLYFITYPVHIREDGSWKKKTSKRAEKTTNDAEKSGGPVNNEKKEELTKSPDEDDGGMTMFNVVFIMNVPREEANERVSDIYDNVAKTFNKALRYTQASSNYVWKESELILSMKEKAREERRPMSWLWNEILIKSTMASATRDIFEAVTNNLIAKIHLPADPPLDLSVQIPIPRFLVRIPSPTERAMPGLLLTSADPLVGDDDGDHPHVNRHYAMLLLDDESKIIAEIEKEGDTFSAPMIECIRLCKPTISLQQACTANAVDLSSIQILVEHLMYYRRAIAIPPLHGRETYIVNPNCDMRKLPTASIAWKRAFPLAPSLSGFLSAMSAAPRPYKTFSPSKDHRATYLEMLAWLIRGGWVTQLRTFAWVLVWPEIRYEVDYQLKAEAIEKAKTGKKSTSGSSTESTDESGPEKISDTDPSAPLSTEQVAENARLERLADKAAKQIAEEAAAFAKLPVPVATLHPSIVNAEHLRSIPPYIIKDPHKVSHEESLYIAAIGKRITDRRAKDKWAKFTKYFNGSEALEMIPLKETMKRKETWGILMQFQEHLHICKHW